MEKYKISIACIIESNEKFLMVKEEQNGKISWDIPAGGIELHETLDKAVTREVHEETGLSVTNSELKAILLFQEPLRTTANFVYGAKLTNINSTELHALDTDIVQVKWFTKSEILKILNNQGYEHEMAKKRLLFILEGFSEPLSVINI